MGCLKAGPLGSQTRLIDASSDASHLQPDGQEATRHHQRTVGGEGAVSGNDQRVAVVIFTCACVYVWACGRVHGPLLESRWSSQQMAQS